MNHKERAFDHLLRQRLDAIQPPPPPGSWELMQQMLQDLDAPNPFDAALASQLQAPDTNMPQSQWERMEQELELDELVHGSTFRTAEEELAWKLQHLQARYNPKHWELLAHQLNFHTHFSPGILRSKLVELSVLLLFLLFFLHDYQPGQPAKPQDIVTSERPAAEVTQTPAAAPAADQAPPLPPTIPVSTPLATSQPAKAIAAQSKLQNPADNHNLPLTSDQTTSPDLLAQLPPPITGEPAPFAPEASLTSSLPGLNLPALRLETPEVPTLPIASLQPTPHWYLSMGASADRNIIQTPFDPTFQTAPLSHGSFGHSSGLSLSRRTGQLELLAGVWHSTKAYRPPVPVQQFGTFDLLVVESFEGIHLDLLQIPLQLSYHFRKSPRKWNAYAHAGLQASFILDAVYDIRRSVVQAQGKPREADDTENLKSRLDRKDFPKGLAAGGQLNNNFLLSLSAGVGVERRLNDRWILFAQPTYTRQISTYGIGPNNDRLHNWSMLVGSRVLIR